MAQAELSNQEVSFVSEAKGRGGIDVQVPSQSKPRNKSHYKGPRKTRGARSNANNVDFEMNNFPGLEQSYREPFVPGVTFENSRTMASTPSRYNNDDYHRYGNHSKQNYRGGRRNDNIEREVRLATVSGSFNKDRIPDNSARVVESSNLLPDGGELSEPQHSVSSNMQKMPNAEKKRSEQRNKHKNSAKLRDWTEDNGFHQGASYRESKLSRVNGLSSNRQPSNRQPTGNGERVEMRYSNKCEEEREQTKSDETVACQQSSSVMYSNTGATCVSHDSFKSKSFSKSTGRSSTSANGYAHGYNTSSRNGRRNIPDSRRDNSAFYNGQQTNERYDGRQYEPIEHNRPGSGVSRRGHYHGDNETGNDQSRVEHLDKHHTDRRDLQGFHSQSWKREMSSSSGNKLSECSVHGLSINDASDKYTIGESSSDFRKDWDRDTASAHYERGKTPRKFTSFKKNDQKLPVEDETQRDEMIKHLKVPVRLCANQQYSASVVSSHKRGQFDLKCIVMLTNSLQYPYSDEMLIDQLTKNTYECMICCNVVRRETAIWNCSNCYHVFHLYCIKRWANSSSALVSGGDIGQNCWRCPACQNPTSGFPNSYMCFCGKSKDPEFSQFSTPHSCGETCGRQRANYCPHNCTLQCHPGPCPACPLFVTRACSCGKTKQTVKCSNATVLRCDEPCGKTLNCGRHDCAASCHDGPCEPCDRTISQNCHCGKDSHNVVCGSQESFVKFYSCEKICSRLLECKNHSCEKVCHEGNCEMCSLQPAMVTHCPCGKKRLVEIPGSKPRASCTDEIQTCNLICQKPLLCGPEDTRHKCSRPCHTGPCGPCDGMTDVTCQCGSSCTQMPCRDLTALLLKDEAGYRCDRRCNKKMSCGRHKCGQLCCFNADHICRLICGYKLSCGEHKCEEPCHRGNCPACWRVSFDELRCHCGTEVIYPPVPCGTQAPACSRPCTRTMPCGHKVNHPCHSDPVCPPCAVLSQKWCHGRHELRSNIPCYVADVSCGRPCSKSMPCQVHKCAQTCHKGGCPPCRQPCPAPRPTCGHPCSSPCHIGSPCPSSACKTEILVRCECGRREERVVCMQGASGESRDAEYSKMAAQSVAAKLWEGQSIDIAVLKKELKNRKLACTSECAIMERNQRIALALEIKNPDISGKLGNPSFSVFLKEQAKLNPSLVSNVEKALTDIVLATQQSKVGKKSHSFKSMPSVQRRLIHELAEFYGCQSESYDEEPNKNVVATAVKDKCWLPNVTLTSLVQRELFPKAPMPIPISHKESELKSAAKAAKQSTQVYSESKTSCSTSTASKRTGGQTYVDYFDMTD